jgi:hypothetical protein
MVHATRNFVYSESENSQYLNYFFLQSIYLTYTLTLNNYNQPFLPILNSDILTLSASSKREEDYFLKISNLNTDSGLILEELESMKTFSYDFSKSLVMGRQNKKDFFWSGRFTISNIVETYTRKYIKLQNIFADAGGFLKSIMLIFTFINNYFTNIFFFDKLLVDYYNNFRKSLKGNSKNDISNNNSIEFFKSFHTKLKFKPISKTFDIISSEKIFIQSFKSKVIKNKNSKNSPDQSNTKISNDFSHSHRYFNLKTKQENISKDLFELNIFPKTWKNAICFCKNKNKNNNINFENIFKSTLDIQNIFLNINRLKFLEKIILNETQRKFEKMTLYRVVLNKLLKKKNFIKASFKNSNYYDIKEQLKNAKNVELNLNKKLLEYEVKNFKLFEK